MTDSLEMIVERQLAFQERLRPKYEAFFEGHDYATLYLKENILMIIVEATEALNNLNWKMHKGSFGDPMTDDSRRKFIEEVTDILHFAVNLFIGAGVMNVDDIMGSYLDKIGVNNKRQDEGY